MKVPVSHGFAAGAFLCCIIATGGANSVVDENTRHWSSVDRLVPFEIGVDLKILGGRVLDQVQKSSGYYKHGENEL